MNKKAVLLGSKPGSVVALLLLLQRGWTVSEVVASPDQAAWLPRPSLYDVASSFGIRTVADQSQLESTNVDLLISYMFRSRVRRETLERGRYALNFHAGPLPEFGGWAFYNVAILEECPEYGCTCHIMDEGFDTGPLVKVRRFSINSRLETALSLEKRSQIEMILLFSEVISAYEVNGKIQSNPQDPTKMRYLRAEQFAQLKQIPLDATPEESDRIARAFWYPPYKVAYYRLPSGTEVEVIPQIAKTDIAKNLHADDFEDLARAVGLSLSTFGSRGLARPRNCYE